MARRVNSEPVDPYAAARDTCYRLLGIRPRSRQELLDAVLGKGVDEQTARDVLDRFERAGLVDDAAFAQEWVRARTARSGLSRAAVLAELRRKGVDGDSAGDAVAQIDDDAEYQRARELVRRKLRASGGSAASVDEAKLMRRLLGVLARKGYSSELAHRVVREEVRAHGVDDDAIVGADPVE